MRRWVLRAVVALAVVAGAAIVTFGPARLRPWLCHHHGEKSTPLAAAHAYYASCWSESPARFQRTHSGPYSEWDHTVEFAVSWDGGENPKIRFLIVGRQAADSWVVVSEGTGP